MIQSRDPLSLTELAMHAGQAMKVVHAGWPSRQAPALSGLRATATASGRRHQRGWGYYAYPWDNY